MRIALIAAAIVLAASTAAHAGDAAHGQQIFREQCGICHQGGAGDGDGGAAPNLKGVVGRKAGSLPDFAYTPAIKASGLTWTPESLDRFLTDPQKLVPGTAMPVSIDSPKDRQDIIAYLQSLHP